MFPRKKKNRTGTISVVVVDKSRGGFKEVRRFGVAKTEEEADHLFVKASEWVRRFGGQQEIDFAQSSVIEQEFLESERVLSNISAVVLNGPQQILNQVYDSIGFNRIKDEILRHLVIARICQPLSKSATADYLKSGECKENSLSAMRARAAVLLFWLFFFFTDTAHSLLLVLLWSLEAKNY